MSPEELYEVKEKFKALVDTVTDGALALYSLFADDEGVRFSVSDGTTITGVAPMSADAGQADLQQALGLGSPQAKSKSKKKKPEPKRELVEGVTVEVEGEDPFEPLPDYEEGDNKERVSPPFGDDTDETAEALLPEDEF